ncbi:MAG: hypothetical protein R8F63_14360 [Acidimicrobiales bacterium]|nr:hypothetical protein [Acidimicrobiales bacterium]
MTQSLKRWLAILAAVMLLAAACGDDGGSDADPGGDDGSADDSSADDSSADDSGADDSSADDSSADDSSADDSGSDDVPMLGNCDEFAAAIDGLDSLADAGDPTAGNSPDDVRADFAQAQASLAALRSQLPDDLKGDADVIAAGLAAMEEAFAAIGYDASTLTSPEDALQFAAAMANAEVLAMATASLSLQQWVLAGCNG